MFSVDFGLMANIAFNCRAEENPDLDFVDSCVEWVRAIWFHNLAGSNYIGDCEPGGPPLQERKLLSVNFFVLIFYFIMN